MGSNDVAERFVEDLRKSIAHVLQTGQPRRFTVGGKHGDVTIDIYTSKASMKVFNEAVLSVAKKERGLSVSEVPNGEA